MFKKALYLFLIFIAFQQFFAQSTKDFEEILSNSYRKLYEDPSNGIRIAKGIGINNAESTESLLSQQLLMDGYEINGEYTEAIRALTDISKTETGSTQLLIAHFFMEFGLEDQAEKEIKAWKRNRKSFNKSSLNLLTEVRYFYTKAEYLTKKKKFAEAISNLQQASLLLPQNGDFLSHIIKSENLLAEGHVNLFQKNIEGAKTIAEQLQLQEQRVIQTPYFGAKYNYFLGLIALQNKQESSAIGYFENGLQQLGEHQFPVERKKFYLQLSQLYFSERNMEKYEMYQKKYNELQSKIEEDRRTAMRDLVQLDESTENQVLTNSKIQKRKTLVYTALGCVVVILVVSIWYFQELQKKKILEQHAKLLEREEVQNKQPDLPHSITAEVAPQVKTTDTEPQKKTLIIPKETEEEILQKLLEFEKSQAYLDKQLSLGAVASQLGTNTKYLSEIINKYKEKSFTSYINELRINYITHLIDTDPAYHQYKISYLADLAGFITHSTFTVVFKTVKGMSPNTYIQQARKNTNS